MNLLTIIIIITAVLSVGLFFAGRELFLRSVRVRNRLQMNAIYTNITHELLTPLTVISASIERLRSMEPKTEHEQSYDLMQLNIDRMVRLLQQILETNKSQSGELKLLVAYGDVMQYIQQTALCIEPLMAQKRVKFTIQCLPESMMGWIDTDKLDKIIYNLLSNAAKYTPGENGKVLLQVKTNKKYDHIIIRVSDNGIGIPQEEQKKLFRRFHDGAYRQQSTIGTGLGLALTRELVFLHGGSIDYESEEGKGTVFTVTLPINKEAFSTSQIDEKHQISISTARNAILDIARRMHDQEATEAPVVTTINDDAYKLLVVEDNIELLMLLNQLLSSKYRIKTANNGQEALEAINKEAFDLIVSDVMMPVMDGLELTRRIKSDPIHKHLPIILLTAKTQEEDRNEALQAGADSYLTKPFKLSDLEVRINNIIENRQRVQADMVSLQSNIIQPEVELTADELFLKRAYECVRQHLSDSDYDRETFANDMGASASTLYNKLRALTGMNVSNFIRDQRMKAAMEIIQRSPDIRISDLAYKVGFKDPKYFSTCFKKEFGTQPSEYIENLTKDR